MDCGHAIDEPLEGEAVVEAEDVAEAMGWEKEKAEAVYAAAAAACGKSEGEEEA